MLILGQMTHTFQNMKFKAHPRDIFLHFVVSRRGNFNITSGTIITNYFWEK